LRAASKNWLTLLKGFFHLNKVLKEGAGIRSGIFGMDCVSADPVHRQPAESPDYEIKLAQPICPCALSFVAGFCLGLAQP
jgi:hypothetical protein